MGHDSEVLQKAIEDLSIIRRAIDKAEVESADIQGLNRASVYLNKRFLQGALLLSLVFLAMEIFSGFGITGQLLLSAHNEKLRNYGLGDVAYILALFVAFIYGAVWHVVRKSKADFDSFVSRRFHYLRNLSFFSDVFTRFVVFAMIIVAGRPEWIAPLFMVFIGDYLVQGKVFSLPMNISLLLGLGCFGGAAVLYALGTPSLVYPLLVFAAAAVLSLYYTKALLSPQGSK